MRLSFVVSNASPTSVVASPYDTCISSVVALPSINIVACWGTVMYIKSAINEAVSGTKLPLLQDTVPLVYISI